jgi:drug/metabolite transporter (DMT)-like permease
VQARTCRRLSRFVGCFVATLFVVILTSCLAAMILVALAAEEQRTREFYDLIISCAVMVLISTIASSLLQKLLRERDLVEEHVEYKYV